MLLFHMGLIKVRTIVLPHSAIDSDLRDICFNENLRDYIFK